MRPIELRVLMASDEERELIKLGITVNETSIADCPETLMTFYNIDVIMDYTVDEGKISCLLVHGREFLVNIPYKDLIIKIYQNNLLP